jgi:hypothetical protein
VKPKEYVECVEIRNETPLVKTLLFSSLLIPSRLLLFCSLLSYLFSLLFSHLSLLGLLSSLFSSLLGSSLLSSLHFTSLLVSSLLSIALSSYFSSQMRKARVIIPGQFAILEIHLPSSNVRTLPRMLSKVPRIAENLKAEP